MTEFNPQNTQPSGEVPTPPVAHPPAKIPMKIPYVLPKATFTQAAPNKGTVSKRREDSDDDDNDAAILGVTSPSKKLRSEPQRKRATVISESSSSSSESREDSSSDSSSGDDESSNTSSSGSESSSGNDNSRSSSLSTGYSDNDNVLSGDELTLFQIAKEKGIVSENITQEEENVEEEDAPIGPPPRPPIVRSFPHDIDSALRRYEEKLNREENMIRIKDENKAVSLGTSKINYIDPRIVCSWAKEHDVPIGKIFSATIQKKFPWAMGAENFSF